MRILVRPARAGDAAGIAKVHVETWRTAYRSLVDADHLAQLSVERSAGRWAPRIGIPGESLFVAEENGTIIGFCHGGPNRGSEPLYRGELYSLYLLEERQRRGVGRRLVLALAEALQAASLRSMIVWILTDNPSRRFYEGLGGRAVGTKPATIGRQTLEEVGYGWAGLEALLDLKVRIVDYDPGWPLMYEEERARLSGALGDAIEEIQHIGSTAVPGLGAKPVIDILLGMRRYPLDASQVEALLSLGYEDLGESGIAGRRFFRKGVPRTHHVHATVFGGSFWTSHLRFRDHLLSHPEALRDYDRLKRRLVRECGDDRAAYTDAKAGFIQAILGSA